MADQTQHVYHILMNSDQANNLRIILMAKIESLKNKKKANAKKGLSGDARYQTNEKLKIEILQMENILDQLIEQSI